jgi:site-specific recombinase XerD
MYLVVPDPTRTLDEVRFHSPITKRSYLSKREAEILLSPMDKQVTDVSSVDEENFGIHEPRRRALAGALAARDHAAFSAMIYAGVRIEETTALTLEDLSFARGEEEVRVARGKGNKERVVPMSPKLRRSLKRYLKVRDELVPAGRTPPPYLFLNENGSRITENTLRRRLYGWVRKSGLKKADKSPTA